MAPLKHRVPKATVTYEVVYQMTESRFRQSLPSGSPLAAGCHLLGSICRRTNAPARAAYTFLQPSGMRPSAPVRSGRGTGLLARPAHAKAARMAAG